MKERPRLILLLLPLLLGGCGGEHAPDRAPGSALWVTDASRALPPAELRLLARGGITELFVEAGELDWAGGSATLKALPLYRPPERTPATLVLRGPWPVEPPDAGDAAESLAPAVRGLLGEAPARGLEVSGLHLHLEMPDGEAALKGLAELIRSLRREVGGRVAWSASLDVEAPGVAAVAEATDFFVVVAYGRPPGEADDPDAWSFAAAEHRARLASDLDRPFLLGVETLGWARLEDGTIVTRTDLTQLAWDRQLEVGRGFTLEGADRLTYRFVARAPTFLGGRELAPGAAISVQATSSAHLAHLMQSLREELGESYRGVLFHRLGGLGEGLALGPGSLVHGLEGTDTSPELEAVLLGGSRSASRWVVEVRLRETAGEPTDLGFELAAPEGSWFGEVEPGNFYRYELFRRTPDGSLERTLRRPEVVRLYAPFLPADGELRSGPIRVVHRGDRLAVGISGSFLAPFGREIALGPVEMEPAPPGARTPEGDEGEGATDPADSAGGG